MDSLPDIYARKPLTMHGTIPVFSSTDDYTENYARIATDHLTALSTTGQNPFIPEELWVQLEEATAERIRHYASAGDRILDIGVGTGRLLARFPELQRFGNDIAFNYLEMAQQHGIEVCYSRIEELPYRPGLFDIVVCTDVLEHVLNLHVACENIITACKPGGVIIIRVPNQEDLTPYTAPEYPYTYVHLRTFDAAAIRLLFERIFGLTILDLLPCVCWPLRTRMYAFPRLSACDLAAHLFTKVSKRLRAPWFAALCARLYRPMEIVAVMRKTL